ncbi:hypothetical protein E4U22_003117, partial [Claviceps purpurea]
MLEISTTAQARLRKCQTAQQSPGEVPEAATLSTQAQDPVPDSVDPKTKVAKVNFKPDGLYVYTNPGKRRRRNILLFPIEIKPGYAGR